LHGKRVTMKGMEHKRLLVQTQLSSYDTKGIFNLECDSGWQMAISRCREMLKLDPTLHIDIMCPQCDELNIQCKTHPTDIHPDLWAKHGDMDGDGRLRYIEHNIIPNALATRYDFKWHHVVRMLQLSEQKLGLNPRYDMVLVNDPMHLRTFRAAFHVLAGYVPRFFVHSHFIDCPSCPKFPTEASLWLGQVEAALRADWNFWQCSSALQEFEREARKLLRDNVVDYIMSKSDPWDDGYSIDEITSSVDVQKMRFTPEEFRAKTANKKIIFVPNRIGGKGRSSDYTNCGRFMFKVLPELRKLRQDFVVIAGNPNQKILNNELEEWCGGDGYVSLVPDSFTRDEYKFVAKNSDIAVGLYTEDTYGGTAARECIELGCTPAWTDCNEYASLARKACFDERLLIAPGLSNAASVVSELLDHGKNAYNHDKLLDVVRKQCSYESTTPLAMKWMGLL